MEEYNQYGIIPLAERMENAYKSSNGLYPHEIIVLFYASKYSDQDTVFSGFWLNRYGISDVREILRDLFEKGFIKYASVEETVKHQKVPQIKEFLKNHRLKVTGNKDALIERVLQNVSQDELEQYFTTKYYELTELGIQEVKSNQALIYIHNKPLNNIDIWVANKWIYENPGIPFEDIVFEKLDNELKSAVSKKDYGMYLNIVYGAIRFNIEKRRFEDALREIAHQIYFEVNAARSSQSEWFIKYSMKYVFPYSTAVWKLSHDVKTILANLKHALELDNDQIIDALSNLVDDIELSFEMFDKRECALVAVYDMRNETDKIEKIYTDVEKRIRDKYPYVENEAFLENGKIPKELSEKERALLNRKEQILLDSFNVLKDDIKTNHEQLEKIMAQLQESQPETVIELWRFLLEENWNHVVKDKDQYDSISTYLTADMMQALTDESGFIIFEKYFVSEPKILQAVYQYSPQLPPWSTSVIATQIRSKNFETANMMLEYMYANKKNNFIKNDELCNYCFSNIYKDWIEEYITTSRTHYGAGGWQANLKVSEEIFEFLSYWVDQIKDPQEKVRTNVFLMELI